MGARLGAAPRMFLRVFCAVLFIACPAWGQSDVQVDLSNCQYEAAKFIASQTPVATPSDLVDRTVFFLHVPRTAGRTYNSCFLKQAYPPSKRCARSYDMLRYNISLPTCRLLSSHDDYSIVSTLPADAAVITQLRDPVDRLLSAYEFTIEVASRSLGRKNKARRAPPKSTPGKTDTRNVWPWSILVPWMEDILRTKLEAVQRTNPYTVEGDLDPYDNVLTMTLREFAEHPLVDDLLHDGATLQELGLTNYSISSGAGYLRACFKQNEPTRRVLLDYAKARVGNFSHVGTTDRLYDSIVSLAGSLGKSMFGPAWKTGTPGAIKYVADDDGGTIPKLSENEQTMLRAAIREKRKEFDLLKSRVRQAEGARRKAKKEGGDTATAEKRIRQMAARMKHLRNEATGIGEKLGVDWMGINPRAHAKQVKPDADFQLRTLLWRAFRECESRTKNKQSSMKSKALVHLKLTDGRTFSYSKAKRKAIDPALIDRIRRRNMADTELHQYGLVLLQSKLDELKAQGKLEELPSLEEGQRLAADGTLRKRAAAARGGGRGRRRAKPRGLPGTRRN